MCIQGMHPFVDCVHTTSWWWTPLTFTPPLPPRRRRHIRLEKLIPVTRLSASLLTSWLFPDKYSRPLDSTPLSPRIMANYQEAVCWKDAARNCICLQTVFRFKHVLWKNERNNNNNKKKKRLPSATFWFKRTKNCLQRIMWLLRNAWVMTNMWTGLFIYFMFLSFLPKTVYQDTNETRLIKAWRQRCVNTMQR